MADSQTTQVGYTSEIQEYGFKIRSMLADSYIRERPITLGTKTGDRFECVIDFYDKEDGIVHLRIHPVGGDLSRYKMLSIPECQISWILV
jgi:hypothetical protein